MRLRAVVGKRIVAVEQQRVQACGGPAQHVNALVLEDGTRLILHPVPLENECAAVEVKVFKGGKKIG